MIRILVLYVILHFASQNCYGASKFIIDSKRGTSHRLIKHTNVYCEPLSDYLLMIRSNGIRSESNLWYLTFQYESEELKDLIKRYEKHVFSYGNFEEYEVSYKNKYTGKLYKYFPSGQNKINFLMWIDVNGKVLKVNGSANKDLGGIHDGGVMKMLKSLYLESDENISDSERNPFFVNEDEFKFSCAKDDEFIYTRDSNCPTNEIDKSEIVIHKVPLNIHIGRQSEYFFTNELGENYIILEKSELIADWIRESKIYSARSVDNSKLAYYGIIVRNDGSREIYVFHALCHSDFSENLLAFKAFSKTINHKRK